MSSLVLFTTQFPSVIVDELTRVGFRVFEALAISEVLHLCETEHIDIVVITAEISDHHAKVIEAHQITLRLKDKAMPQEVIAELWRLFPTEAKTIQ